ncbi:GTPase [Flavobacterium pectinovorum]|uniref:GTPase n=1 Tax=Flavobacterium pectinovorum TaxID=29533 RepID=UPI001FAD443E|nr:GTPase [Flavobacterium pectinovorum]MCI9845625.1 50S ribosome-binding GTPase [Flavobacterium pectinovorum]
METVFENLSISEIIENLKKEYDSIKNATVNIAISGQSGAGKSSLINAIIGRKVAEVGITETTLNIKKYVSNGIHFSDLPGCGTEKFPIKTYLENCNLESFDAVIVVTANRFYENDVWLIKEMIRIGRPVYVVRTKMDTSINDGMHDDNLTEYEVFEKVKNDIKSNIGNIDIKGIYLTSSREPLKMDLSKLLIDIQHNLSGIKKQRFIADVAPLNEQVLKEKSIVAQKAVSYGAYAAAANGINPIPGLDIGLDIAILIKMSTEIQNIYGLDEKSIDELSKRMGNTANFTAIKAKVAQYATKFIAREGIMILLKRLSVNIGSKEVLKYIPFVGQIAAAGIGYKMTDSFGCDLIEESEALVREILIKSQDEITR